MWQNNFKNTIFQNLKVKVMILGSKKNGECIVIQVIGNNIHVITIIIDFFTKDIIDILKKEGIKEIDYLIWSHPHEDHGKDLVELFENGFFKFKNICFPNHTLDILKNSTYSCDSAQVISKYLTNLCKKQRANANANRIEEIAEATNHFKSKERLILKDQEVNLEFFTLSPPTNITCKASIIHNYEDFNMISIANYFAIGDAAFIFTSDIPDSVINRIRTTFQEEIINPILLKAPHHGSSQSLQIVDLMREVAIGEDTYNSLEYIVCTKYGETNPSKKALEEYSKIADHVYMIPKNIEQDISVFTFEYDLDTANITINPDGFSEYCSCKKLSEN